MSRITDFELYQVPPCWLLLRLETADGLVGWGECTLEGRTVTVEAEARRLLENYLVGADPDRVTYHSRRIKTNYHNHRGPILSSALGGIDMALWDLKGKRHGATVSALLGGQAREAVELYHPFYGGIPQQDGFETRLRSIVEEGFSVIKTTAGGPMYEYVERPEIGEVLAETIGDIRSTIGPTIHLGLDFNGRLTPATWERVVAAIEPYDVAFVEEPVTSEQYHAIDADRVTPAVAAGERVFDTHAFARLFEQGVFDVAQPDLIRAAGITGCRAIAATAATYDVPLIPNCSAGPIGMAACLHLCLASPNAIVMPYTLAGSERARQYVENVEEFEQRDGRMYPNDRDGLGIALEEDRIATAADGPVDWHPYDHRFRADGTPTH